METVKKTGERRRDVLPPPEVLKGKYEKKQHYLQKSFATNEENRYIDGSSNKNIPIASLARNCLPFQTNEVWNCGTKDPRVIHY